MKEVKYKTTYQVLEGFELDELARKLTMLSDESHSITVIKTTKVKSWYECLVKRVQQERVEPSQGASDIEAAKKAIEQFAPVKPAENET